MTAGPTQWAVMGGDGAATARAAETAAILRALSSLAIDRRKTGYDVSGSGPTAMAWLGTLHSGAESGDATMTAGGLPWSPAVAPSAQVEALARYDALRSDAIDLRLGWMWVVTTAVIDGSPQRIVLPLLSRPARVRQDVTGTHVVPVTAWDLWQLVEDPDMAAALEAEAAFGGGALDPKVSQPIVDRLPVLQSWTQRVLAASGLHPARKMLAPVDPRKLTPTSDVQVVAGYGLYADASADPSRPKETLANWSTNPDVANTALASVYLGASAPSTEPPGGRTVRSPYALTERQDDVIAHTDHRPVTVVSGPPGTGKSHTAVAAALHAVMQGQSVLVATQSPMAADVLAELLDRVPGPTPVLFGGGKRASQLALKLADGLEGATNAGAQERHAQAEDHVRMLTAAVRADLAVVEADARWRDQAPLLASHMAVAPLLLGPAAALAAAPAAALVEEHQMASGLFAGRRRKRAERALRALVEAPATATWDQLVSAVDLAATRDHARLAVAADRPLAPERWSALVDAERERRLAAAAALAQQIAGRVDGQAHRAVAALATALRSGRAARRSHLAGINVAELTSALPLWVGTLGDIEHLLPATAGAFDLVILDEASQIDQLSASAALLRAKRALIIGDPRQLRFVSFLADSEITATLRAEGLGHLRDRLDLRRISAFDLGASATEVTFLDEHFRCVPHLIGFSAQRFYDGRLHIATRHPRNEHTLAIEVRHLDGERHAGVNQAEVAAAVAAVQELLATTTGTIGVISPYRAQVDAVRKSVGEQIPLEQLQSGRVTVATVHGIQGAERDVVVASFGVSGASGTGRGFLEDPHLFNVLVTRARHRLIVLSTGTPPTTGLLAEYLAWARNLPNLPDDRGPADTWTKHLMEVLTDRGTPVRAGYQVGQWTVDLMIGTGAQAVAVTTRVHPQGANAHLRRHVALAAAGWRQAEAFPATRDGDAVATALDLTDLLSGAR